MRLERKQETKAVKQALQKVGINARVGHGRGTAWGWLEINVGAGQQFGEHVLDDVQAHRNCPRCQNIYKVAEIALKIAQDVTERSGPYDGNISVLTQDHWSDKKGNIKIEHNLQKLNLN